MIGIDETHLGDDRISLQRRMTRTMSKFDTSAKMLIKYHMTTAIKLSRPWGSDLKIEDAHFRDQSISRSITQHLKFRNTI